jgi:hypothetical protein
MEASTLVDGVRIVARRGAAAMPPEREYGPEEIDALGASDIGEVIGRLDEVWGGRSSPVVIVNGQRLADPAAFLSFPPDALSRVEILPPSAATVYGAADPSRRVVNIVLQRRFDGRDIIASNARPTAGGQSSASGDLRRSQIVDLSTSRAGLRISRDTSLRAGERLDYERDHPGDGVVTLRPRSDRLAIDAGLTRVVGGWNGSIAAKAQSLASRFVSGAAGQEIQSQTDQRTLAISGGVNGKVLGWSFRALLNGQASRTQSSGLSEARIENQTIGALVSLNRDILILPAGPMGLDVSGQASRSRASTTMPGSRRSFSGQTMSTSAQVSIPLHRAAGTDRRDLGDLSASFGVAERSTDAGRGTDMNTSLYWAPVKALSLNAAWSRSINAPSDDQRFGATVYTAPITVYDFRTGRSVAILPLIGGNPGLRSPKRQAQTLGVSMGPFGPGRLFGSFSYRRSTATDEIGMLADATSDLEAAFPDRFKRDANGVLLSIDQRPVNFAADTSRTLSTTLNATFALPRRSSTGPSALQVSLDHLWRLSDAVLIHPGLPRLDRLAGDSGASPHHELNVRLDARRGPLGGSLGVRWKDSYRLRFEGGRDGARDLKVRATSTANLKFSYAFASVGEPPSSSGSTPRRRAPGAILALDIDNLFDTRPDARLADGRRAPGYGRDDKDPIGRLIRLSLTSRF